jgi:hypothetical protein
MFQINETKLIGVSCVYQINVKTSCHSPPLTTDAIGISIGDADGNEVLFYSLIIIYVHFDIIVYLMRYGWIVGFKCKLF